MNAFYLVVDENYLNIASIQAFRLASLWNVDVHVFIEGRITKNSELKYVSDPKIFYHHDELGKYLPKGLPESAKWPTIVYLRMFAPSVLQNYQRLVYLDADILPLRKDDFIWSVPLPSGLGAVHDTDVVCSAPSGQHYAGKNSKEAKEGWLKGIGLENKRYFNSGVLLIEPEKWLQKNWADLLSTYVQSFGESMRMFDQDFLNFTFQGIWTELSPRYNFQASIMGFGYENTINPIFLHFSLTDKPWLGRYVSDIMDLDQAAFLSYERIFANSGFLIQDVKNPKKISKVSRAKCHLRRWLSEHGWITHKERALRKKWSTQQDELNTFFETAAVSDYFADKLGYPFHRASDVELKFDGKRLRACLSSETLAQFMK